MEISRLVLSLWDFDDPAGSRSRFADAAAIMQTQIARTHGLAGDFAAGHAVLDAIAATTDVELRVRILLERGRLLRSGGDPSAAEPHFREAFALASTAGLVGLAADLAHMLALVLPDEHSQWAHRGLAIAEGSTDPLALAMTGALLNNLGWTFAEADRWDEAYPLFERAVAARQSVVDTLGGRAALNSLHIARWTRARAARALGRRGEALAELESLAATEIGAADPFVAEELALNSQ